MGFYCRPELIITGGSWTAVFAIRKPDLLLGCCTVVPYNPAQSRRNVSRRTKIEIVREEDNSSAG